MVDEKQIRRALKKDGYALKKSRSAVNADNFGGYMIVDIASNAVVTGSRYELTLEDVAEWMKG